MSVCLFLCPLRMATQRICTKFVMWHPYMYALQMVTGGQRVPLETMVTCSARHPYAAAKHDNFKTHKNDLNINAHKILTVRIFVVMLMTSDISVIDNCKWQFNRQKPAVAFVRSFILCEQGSSLLWTPALRHLNWFNVPAQGEEGSWWVCVVWALCTVKEGK